MTVIVMNGAAPKRKYFGGGAKLVIPPGDTIVSLVRHGMALKTNASTTAAAIRLSTHAFLFVRKLLTLKDQHPLNVEERRIIDEALQLINDTRQLTVAQKLVKDIVIKYWSRKTITGKTEKEQRIEAKIRKRLDSTLFLIRETCTNNDELQVPLLSSQEKIAAITLLAESIAALSELLNRIQGRE